MLLLRSRRFTRPAAVAALCALTACGGGGGSGGAPAAPLPPAITGVTTPLNPSAPTTLRVTGTNFPGAPGLPVTITVTAADGLPLMACGSPALVLTGTLENATSCAGTLPPFPVTRDVDARVRVEFVGGALAASAAALLRLVRTVNPTIDQDLDGVLDGCDPHTYDFQADAPGAVPAGTSNVDDPSVSLAVADVAGERAARGGPAGGPVVQFDRFDRLSADFPFQDTTAYVDVESAAAYVTLELWSEGSLRGASGGGVLLQAQADGRLVYYERLWGTITKSVVGPLLPPSRRLRLRLVKGPGVSSVLHVDAWTGSQWAEDHARFDVVDDHSFRGLEVTLGSYFGGLRGIERLTVVHAKPAAMLALGKSPRTSSDWRLFQRGVDGTAAIPVRTLRRLTGAGRLQARVVHATTGETLPAHEWTDHEQAVAPGDGGRVDLLVPGVPTGGNYDVHVRLLDDGAGGAVVGQAALRDLAVGDVFIAAGQSNMSGYPGTLFGADTPIPEVHVLHNDGTWRQAEEPMDDGLEQVDLISRETPAASCMLAFGKELFLRTGVPVAVVPAPLGGTNLYVQWQRDAVRADRRNTLYGSMLSRARLACPAAPPRGLLWFQGESDALSARTTAQYRADLDRLALQMRTDLAAPDLALLVGQLGIYSAVGAAQPAWLGVQEAQRAFAVADARAGLVTSVDFPLADAIHFSVAGYRTMGLRFATAARRVVYGHAVDERTDLVSATLLPGNQTVRLTYEDSVTGGAAALFRASDGSGPATVTGISVVGTTVDLTLDRALGAGPLVSYGWSITPAAPWLLDVAGVPVPGFDAIVPSP